MKTAQLHIIHSSDNLQLW